METIYVRVRSEVKDKVMEYAKEHRLTIARAVSDLLEQALDSTEPSVEERLLLIESALGITWSGQPGV